MLLSEMKENFQSEISVGTVTQTVSHEMSVMLTNVLNVERPDLNSFQELIVLQTVREEPLEILLIITAMLEIPPMLSVQLVVEIIIHAHHV